jgi:hypothetical protein
MKWLKSVSGDLQYFDTKLRYRPSEKEKKLWENVNKRKRGWLSVRKKINLSKGEKIEQEEREFYWNRTI